MIPLLLQAWRDGYDVDTRKLRTVGLSSWRGPTTRLAYDLIGRFSDVKSPSRVGLPAARSPGARRAARDAGARAALSRTHAVGGIPPVRGAVRGRSAGRRPVVYGMRQLLNLFTRALFDFSAVPLHVGLWLGGSAMILSVLYLVFSSCGSSSARPPRRLGLNGVRHALPEFDHLTFGGSSASSSRGSRRSAGPSDVCRRPLGAPVAADDGR